MDNVMLWIKESIKSNLRIKLDDIIENESSKYSLLTKLKDTVQDSEWHSEGDVHIHTDMVIDETCRLFELNNFTLQDKYILLMAAIFHDIAKPITTKESERNGKIRIIAPKHEYDGYSYLFYRFLDEDMTENERNTILELVGYHQRPKLLVIKKSK
jgi:hypothetical protein